MKRVIITAIASLALAAPLAVQAAPAKHGEGEVKITGIVKQLTSAQVKVRNASRALTFRIPAGFNTGNVMVGDRVQAEGRRKAGVLTLTSIHREDRVAGVAATVSAARHGADDPAGDDRGGHGGRHGADDPAGDDRGGNR